MYKPIIVIPFYNHYNNFEKNSFKLAKCIYPILIVNDGSDITNTKKIKQLCNKFNFKYIENPINKGKGYAVKLGINYAKNNNYTHILQIDADGQHDYDDIIKFIEISKSNQSSIINGAPIYDNSVPKSRLYGRKITKFWVWIETLGANITDTMCGFRVYPLKEIMPIIPILFFNRMGFDTEIIVKSYLNNIKIINLDTKVIYPRNGISHFRGFKDNFEISIMHSTLCTYALYKLLLKWRKNV